VEGGCLGHPRASTVASQLLDRIPPLWLANPCNPCSHEPPFQAPATLIGSVEGRRKEGRVGRGEGSVDKPLTDMPKD